MPAVYAGALLSRQPPRVNLTGNDPVLLRFVQGLGASDSVTIDIGLAQSVEGRGGGQTSVALGVLH